jgi:plasmid stabilization system protein ParE
MSESKSYRIHPEVWLELEAADDWYLERSLDASAEFIAVVYDAFETISHAPGRWPAYLYGTRRFVLRCFPFSIIYLDELEMPIIVAVAHSKRRPGYWKARL